MKSFLSLFLISFIWCQSIHELEMEKYKNQVRTGLDIIISEKIELINGKNIGLVTNHTGIDRNGKSNYDILMKLDNVHLKSIFSPEHGFFGNVSGGRKVDDRQLDNFPTIYSLYGKTRKPTSVMLKGLDIIIYDIQDVGARFYTYISTLGLVMEAAGEAGIPVIVLDRPNPLGGEKIEGPVLDMNFKSFVGMYPIPIRYGLTVGELAKMIIGEKWITAIPDLTVIEMEGWERDRYFNETGLPWITPSPNIPDLETAFLYPGMALLEAIPIVSEGRGTNHPFNWIGAPWINGRKLSQIMNNKNLPGVEFEPVTFTPESIPGKALNPKYEHEKCHGVSIKIIDYRQFESVLTGIHLIAAIRQLYPNYFETKSSLSRLWGNNDLDQLSSLDINQDELLLSYQRSIQQFKTIALKYYLYE